jgi:ketosteroid isomerase-like protein
MAESTRDFLSAWEDYRAEVEGYMELDGDRILVLLSMSGRGKMSGLDLGQMRATGAHVVHLRDGKVTRLARYLDRENALADLGLKE